MPEGFNISAFPKIGPMGLSIDQFPETVRPMSVLDVLETLRWIHADLRQIHVAFRGVFEMQREMASIRGIHTLQKAQFQKYSSASKEIAKSVESQSERISLLDQSVAQQIKEVTARLQALIQLGMELSQEQRRFHGEQEQARLLTGSRLDGIDIAIRGLGGFLEEQFKSQSSIVQDLDKRIAGLSVTVDTRGSEDSIAIDEVSRRVVVLEDKATEAISALSNKIDSALESMRIEQEQLSLSHKLTVEELNQKMNSVIERLSMPWWKRLWEGLRGSRAVR